ncbi:hypothetical protein V2W45_695188 [Cenococcum geophilum]
MVFGTMPFVFYLTLLFFSLKPAVLVGLNSFEIPHVHFWMLYLVFYLSLASAFEPLFFGLISKLEGAYRHCGRPLARFPGHFM